MENIKNFINKYKAEILIAITAIGSIANTLVSEGKGGIVTSIIIALVAVCIEVLKEGFSEKAILLLAKVVELIINSLKENDVVEVNLVKADGKVKSMSLDEIKEELEAVIK